jgi:hypothetical protein
MRWTACARSTHFLQVDITRLGPAQSRCGQRGPGNGDPRGAYRFSPRLDAAMIVESSGQEEG